MLPVPVATAAHLLSTARLVGQCEAVLDLNQFVSSVRSSNPTGTGTFGSYSNGPRGSTISSVAQVGNGTLFFAPSSPSAFYLHISGQFPLLASNGVQLTVGN